MYTATLSHRILKPLVVVTVIVLLVGTRLFCDLGATMYVGQCCAQSDQSIDHTSSATTNHDQQDHDRDCSERSSESPRDTKSNLCCSSWFVFITDPAKLSAESDSDRLLADAIVPFALISSYDPTPAGGDSVYTFGHFRSPDIPLYLATHSIRV